MLKKTKSMAVWISICACTAMALSSCAMAPEQESSAQETAAQEDVPALSAVMVVDGETLTLENTTLSSEEADQCVLVVKNGGSVVLRNCTIYKTGDTTQAEESLQTGVNTALVVQNGGNLVLESCTIETDAKGAGALAAVGENACVVASDTTIVTKQEQSIGIAAVDNGCVLAQNIKVESQGAYSPLMVAGTWNGTIQARGVTGKSAGQYAPCLYSAGGITLWDSQLQADASACAVLEGKNSLSVTESVLESLSAEQCVLVFESEQTKQAQPAQQEGMAEMSVSGGRLSAKQGAAVCVTNTQAQLTITDSAQVVSDEGVSIRAMADRWGSSGSNGGVLILRTNEDLQGTMVSDGLSSIQTEPAPTDAQNANTP